jgi:outer membrane protein TolC
VGEPAFEVPASELPDEWMGARTDIKVLQAEQQAAQKVLKDDFKSRLPEITATFDPQYVTPNGLFQPSKSWRLTFELKQALYTGGGGAGLKRERQANLQIADFNLVERQIQARSQIRAARAAVESAERVLKSAREVLKITIAAFDAGASTNIEVIEAQRTARDVETALAQAEDSLRLAQFDLLVALGRFPR